MDDELLPKKCKKGLQARGESDKLLLINLYGPPSSGKSTLAAGVFADLKARGYEVELATEYAKQLLFSHRDKEFYQQIYITAKQYKKVADIQNYGKIKLAITDSPLLLGLVYSENLHYYEELKALAYKLNSEFENYNVLVERASKYNPIGRFQTEEESDALVEKIKKLTIFDLKIKGNDEGRKTLVEELEKI